MQENNGTGLHLLVDSNAHWQSSEHPSATSTVGWNAIAASMDLILKQMLGKLQYTFDLKLVPSRQKLFRLPSTILVN